MKVAMVGHKVVPSRRGGIELVLTSLCPLLAEAGVEMDVELAPRSMPGEPILL